MTTEYLNHGGRTISRTPSRIAPRGCRALKRMWEADETEFPILGQAQAGMDVAKAPNAICTGYLYLNVDRQVQV